MVVTRQLPRARTAPAQARRLGPGRLRVEVSDPGIGFEPAARDPASDRGWGLELVRRLSDDWRVAGDRNGRVCLELTA